MKDLSLFLLLVFLLIISAFFSGSETGMMSVNRYRLRHRAKKGDHAAQTAVELLKRPDRLLGVILLGNTFANVMASAVATMIAFNYFGDFGIFISTILLTLVILIFSEALPKTWAALHPDRLVHLASGILKILLIIFSPLVFVINAVANTILKIFRVPMRRSNIEPLTAEELRTVVHEAGGKIARDDQQMLLSILNLGKITVEEVMVHRGDIIGIDITESWTKIKFDLQHAKFRYVPVYREHTENLVGTLKVNQALGALGHDELDLDGLLAMVAKPYYIPEGTYLSRQLLNFKKQHQYLAYVVDEYGSLQGLVTIKDIIEEIIGYFDYEIDAARENIHPQEDGSYLVAGNLPVRDLNRIMHWDLPTTGPTTMSGLIIEYLEFIPDAPLCLEINHYRIEIVHLSKNMIAQIRVYPLAIQIENHN